MTKREALREITQELERRKKIVEEDKYLLRQDKICLRIWEREALKFKWKNRKKQMDDLSVVTTCVPMSVIDKAVEEIGNEEVKGIIDKHIREWCLNKNRGTTFSSDEVEK